MANFQVPWASAFGQHVTANAGAKLYFFEVGTTTPKTTYQDADETTPHANPVVADANGVFAPIYFTGPYKIRMDDADDVVINTADNVIPTTDAAVLVGDFDSSTNSSNYPASGSKGQMYKVSTGFTLAAASGSHVLLTGDFIICNKNNATAIDADWDTIKGTKIWIDEDDMASDSAALAPSQQSVKKFVEDGAITFTNKTLDSAGAGNVLTFDGSAANTDITSVSSIDEVGGKEIKYKYLEIGDWNMDGTASVTVAHGLDTSKFINVSAAIKQDVVANPIYDLFSEGGGSISWDPSPTSSPVTLWRTAAGFFDNTDYDQTSYNRGWILITYYE
jgi:hypothetical protein